MRSSVHAGWLVITLVIMAQEFDVATTVKVTTVGSSTGIVIPKEILERLQLQKGDSVYLTETPGGLQITPYRPDFADAIDAGRRIMRRYRNTLRKLAE